MVSEKRVPTKILQCRELSMSWTNLFYNRLYVSMLLMICDGHIDLLLIDFCFDCTDCRDWCPKTNVILWWGSPFLFAEWHTWPVIISFWNASRAEIKWYFPIVKTRRMVTVSKLDLKTAIYNFGSSNNVDIILRPAVWPLEILYDTIPPLAPFALRSVVRGL